MWLAKILFKLAMWMRKDYFTHEERWLMFSFFEGWRKGEDGKISKRKKSLKEELWGEYLRG